MNAITELRYQVGEAWKGAYSPTEIYANAAVVQDPTGLSVYRSLKNGNVNHPLSDTSWWMVIIDLSSIKQETVIIEQNEESRVAAEQSRVSAEQSRVSAEQSRVAAETRRIADESQRSSAEIKRIQNEQTRTNAELVRIAAENERFAHEFERVNNEEDRIQLEAEREQKEEQRIINETNRVSAEQQRVVAEAQRVLEFSQAQAQREQAFEDAEEARDALIEAKVEDITNLQDSVSFINEGLGKYDSVREVTLSLAVAGKFVNTSGLESSRAGYSISNTVSVNPGDIILVPSAQAVPADVSVIAQKATRQYDKVIVYKYTTDVTTGHYLTATADYDSELVYTAVYDSDTLVGWVIDGVQIENLPATRSVTESFYSPLVKQSVSAMPSTGYYVYLSPSSMEVVISGLDSSVNGGVLKVVGWGIFKNIATNFVGAPSQAVIAQAFAQMQAEIAGLKSQLSNLGAAYAKSVNVAEEYKVCGAPIVVKGDGAPVDPPMFIGQFYLDKSAPAVYISKSLTNSVSDWHLI